MSLITADQLKLGYDSQIVVSGLSFTVEEGDYLCIIGENGSGKTTLMKALLGLHKPLEGTLEFADDVDQNEIGYLPQQTVIQSDFPASVREIVLSGCQGHWRSRFFYSAEDKATAKKYMEQVGILDMANRYYSDLSGGQKQRVLLARALCAAVKVLLLDEPVAGLDPNAQENMYEVIRKLNGDGMTIIMISHDLTSALKDANKVLHIGETNYFGTVSEYLKVRTEDLGGIR